MKKTYSIFLFDADDTLFDFSMAEVNAFRQLMQAHSLPFSDETLQTYQQINSALWKRFDAGLIAKAELQRERFAQFLSALGVSGDPVSFNQEYLSFLGQGTYLLPGAKEICEFLHGEGKKLYIVTNGISLAQRARFFHSEICPFFEDIFISEELESQKPQKIFFDRVLSHLGKVNPQEILMVGDSLHSDILGGSNAGLDSCWLNPGGLSHPEHICPTYEIKTLDELRCFA